MRPILRALPGPAAAGLVLALVLAMLAGLAAAPAPEDKPTRRPYGTTGAPPPPVTGNLDGVGGVSGVPALPTPQTGEGELGLPPSSAEGDPMGPEMLGPGHEALVLRPWGGVGGLTAQQQERWKEMSARFRAETLPLRLEIQNRMAEMDTLWSQPGFDRNLINFIAQDVLNLERELVARCDRFTAQVRRELAL